ncbi:MAG: hypothetical protein Q9164_002855 [Protoblastenia rupestris]
MPLMHSRHQDNATVSEASSKKRTEATAHEKTMSIAERAKERMATYEAPEVGTMEYFEWVPPIYATSPDQLAKGAWIKELIKKHEGWIGIGDDNKVTAVGGGKAEGKSSRRQNGHKRLGTVLDYAAGTGYLSQALAPYAERILAIDRSQGMVDIYNEISGKLKEDDTLRCDMRAVCGDLIPDTYDNVLGIDEAEERDYSEFDTIALCLALDLFTPEISNPSWIIHALQALVSRLKEDGILIILEIEKYESNVAPVMDPDNPACTIDGLKMQGNGSLDVSIALQEMGMNNVEYKTGERFQWFRKDGMRWRNETFFVMKARKGGSTEGKSKVKDH